MASMSEYDTIMRGNNSRVCPIRPVKFYWSIKGYHAFRIRPHPEIYLNVELEDNPYDPNAMKVCFPTLQHIPQHLQNAVTQDNHLQRVRHIAGKQIGRCPANLCRAFRLMLEREYATSIVCKCSGEVIQSTRPHLHQQYRRRRGNERHDLPGGGAELKCFYVIYIKRQHFEAAMHILEECLPLVELNHRLYA
ncbi:uncharacterized protein LOC133180108 [Saccostrea echinata]|uniref:uncharacterized protein LOC133180108 n=1 Tax=Saccostrea echinata TaxID=191078 RepID=UPI002A84083F|nr:uncharacterized protein LOC133180108 [Saccostrea echinata]